MSRESRLEDFEREAMPHVDALLRAAKRVTRSAQEAEDAVQETFLRAWKHFDSYETGTNCRAWLFRILFNVMHGMRGRVAVKAEVPLPPESEERTTQGRVLTFDPLARIEGREVLEAADTLAEDHRAVLWLVVVEEFSYRETSEILQVPIGTVMSRLHRARRELRNRLSSGTATVPA